MKRNPLDVIDSRVFHGTVLDTSPKGLLQEKGDSRMSPSPDVPASPPCFGSLGQMAGENQTRFPWRYAIALIIACVVAAMLVLPYEIELERRNADPEGTLVWKPAELALYVEYEDPSRPGWRWGPQEVVAVIVVALLWPLLAIFVGLKLGPAVALSWPPLAGWGSGPRRFRQTISTLFLAVALGIASVVLLWLSGLVLMWGSGDEPNQVSPPSWWLGMLASLARESARRSGSGWE